MSGPLGHFIRSNQAAYHRFAIFADQRANKSTREHVHLLPKFWQIIALGRNGVAVTDSTPPL